MRVSDVAALTAISVIFGMATGGSAAPSATPATRAVARKGPIEISIEIKETHVKAGGRLRFKLGLRNISRSPIAVPDVISRHIESLEESLKFKRGLYVEVVDAEGKRLFAKPFPVGSDQCFTVSSPSTSTPSIDEFPDTGNDPYHSSRLTKLAPGGVLVTPAWELSVHKECEVRNRTSIDGYADLWQFDFERRGEYQVRAVYSRVPPKWIQKASKNAPGPAEIYLETRWLNVVVQ